MQSNDVGNQAAARISDMLQSNPVLTSLDFAFNPAMGSTEIRRLANVARHHNDTLQLLALGQLTIGDELATALGKAVGASNIRTLALPRCGLLSVGARRLSAALRESPPLVTLILRENPIGPKGASYIADGLDCGGALRRLDLSCCSLDEEAVRHIAKPLRTNRTQVADLDLGRSPLGQGRVLCITVYSGPDLDVGSGPGKALFVDTTEPGVLEAFKPWLERESALKVWHNYGFDRHVLYNHGVDVVGFGGDTMHMARLWDASRLAGYSLAALTEELVGRAKVRQ